MFRLPALRLCLTTVTKCGELFSRTIFAENLTQNEGGVLVSTDVYLDLPNTPLKFVCEPFLTHRWWIFLMIGG